MDALKVDTVQVFGLSAEGMEVVTYRDRTKNLRFLSIWNYGEMGKQYEEYYFVEEKLIFVFSESHNYNVPFYLTGEKAKEVGSEPFDPNKTVVKEDRYYFNADKLIRWLDHKKNKIDPNSQDFKDTEKSILDFVEKILEEVKSAKKL